MAEAACRWRQHLAGAGQGDDLRDVPSGRAACAIRRRGGVPTEHAEEHAKHLDKRRRTAMAGSVNKVILIGNLGADPEVRRTQDGRPIANLRVATSETWRDKATGERRERTEWHRVVIFSEGLARIAEQYLKKGSKVYLEGQL